MLLLGVEADEAAWLTGLLDAAESFHFEPLQVVSSALADGGSRLQADVAVLIDRADDGPSRVASVLPSSRIPLVVISHRDDEQHAIATLEAGARGFLSRAETHTRSLVTALLCAIGLPGWIDSGAYGIGGLEDLDPMTGLAPRDLFMDRLGQALAANRRTGQKLALMVVQVDQVKLVYDTLGDAVGKALLRSIGGIFSQSLRETDTAARLGREDFGILITNLRDELDAARIAMNIIDALSRPLSANGHGICCPANVGIATVPRNGDDAETLLRHADAAMVQARDAGPSRLEFYTEEMNTQMLERLALEGGLRTAVEDDALILHYQPIFDLRRGRMVGAEALIRWNHPELGFLAPDRFLPLAEESGLIQQIGAWVLDRACEQAVAWQGAGHEGFRIAVNVSPVQLQAPNFADIVQSSLLRSGLRPKSLEIEITETTLVQEADLTVEALNELKGIGVHLAVDDFGTGYSALAYLKDLPIDVLKIDRSFVKSLMVDPAGATIVEAIVRMAQGLNLATVAEGVEEHDQLLLLGSLGCTRMQGFLCGRPVSARDFGHWIEDPGMRWHESSVPHTTH